MSERKEKVEHELLKLAATFLDKVSENTSLITVTRLDLSPDFKNATIFISVLPDRMQEAALNFTKRQLSDFKHFLKEKTRLKTIPYFDVKIDLGEKNRQRIDEISNEI